MLVVTHQAAIALQAAIEADESPASRVIRAHAFRDQSGKLDVRLEPSKLEIGDKKILFEGRVILATDADGATALSGHTLTVEESDGQARFGLRKTLKSDAPRRVTESEDGDT